MGVKRPSDEEFQESPSKQAKQFDSDVVCGSVPEKFSSDRVQTTATDQDEAADSSDKYILLKDYGNEDFNVTSSLADKELETSLPLSWVTSSSSEEDAGSGEQFPPSFFDDYFPYSYPRRSLPEPEDAYAALMNCPPRKQIPIGPDYQADIPAWNPNLINDEKHRVGTLIISESFPGGSADGDVKIIQGRRECDCLDVGSVRCVRRHIKEARDKLREEVGGEKFTDLGFYDMGEEVAYKWTEKDEGIFHEIIYSNPASLGKNFWRQLPLVFPSRTMKDIVSYYFNVFMLRRRTVQNRSSSLEIDSDDDEWHGNDGTFFGRVGDDNEFVVESLGNRDVRVGFHNGIAYDDEDDSAAADDVDDDDDDDSDDDDGKDDGGGEVDIEVDGGDNGEGANDKDDLKSHNHQLNNDIYSDYPFKMASPSEIREDQNVLEDSSTSCESQLYAGGSCVSFGMGHDTLGSTINDGFTVTGSLIGECNDSSDGFDSGFLLEPGAAKAWDESCSTGYARCVDLLSTCNMIEEIFGPCSSNTN